MISPIYNNAKLTPYDKAVQAALGELQETYSYTIEELNHIKELMMALPHN